MRTFTLLILLTLTSILAQKGSISGYVYDIDTKAPISGVTIVIENSKYKSVSDKSGYFIINNIEPGKYYLKTLFIGYFEEKIMVNISTSENKKIDFYLSIPEVDESKIEDLELTEMNNSFAPRASLMQKKSHSGNGYYQNNFNTEEYQKIDENDFFDVIKKPMSTFSIDVDGASYSNVRRFINRGQMPPADAVRVEEFINYFNYDYPSPTDNKPLRVNLEYSKCPWNKSHNLIQIGIKGKDISKTESKANNLVFLLDVSGSMNTPFKLPLLKKAFSLFVEQLTANDIVSIVVYAGAAGLVLEPTFGNNKEKILSAINNLEAGGSTAGGAGIRLAYKTAEKHFIKGGNNRIILATDGDFNIGISSTSELIRYVEKKRETGVYLNVLGFGTSNIKDERMEQLSNNGNGSYAYIDNILEAKKILVNEVGATLNTIAKDVKIQVEFNPAKVKSYRLVGYENRLLNDQDFEDDKKDAGEIGSGHTVTAIYEIELADGQTDTYDSKYQQTNIKDNAKFSNEVLTVRIRYKNPDEDSSRLIETVLEDNQTNLENTSNDFRFAASVAEFGMLLRNSEFKGSSNFKQALLLAKNSKGSDSFGYRSEYLRLVEAVMLLNNNVKSQIDNY